MNNPNNTNNVNTVENVNIVEYDNKPYSRTYKLYIFIHTMITFFSIYLSFRCNGGFSFGSVLLSIIFPYYYILYSLAVYNGLCVSPTSTK